MMKYSMFYALLPVVLVACTPEDLSTCKNTRVSKSVAGEDVLVCDAFYDNAPLVHVNSKQLAANEWIGALDINGMFTYQDADKENKSVKLVNKQDASTYECKQETYSEGSGGVALGGFPPSSGMYIDDAKDPLNCGMRLDGARFKSLYKVTGALSTDGTKLNTETIKTHLTVTDKAFDRLLYRSFVGTASLRKANYNPDVDGIISYQQDKTAPVVFKPVAYDPKEGVRLTIANLDKAAMGDNNVCYPALTSYRLENPFYGKVDKNELQLYKIYSMHGPGNHTMVLAPIVAGDNGLSNALGGSTMSTEVPASMFLPSAWLNPQLDLVADLKQTHAIHGVPNGLALTLWPARSAQVGKACTIN